MTTLDGDGVLGSDDFEGFDDFEDDYVDDDEGSDEEGEGGGAGGARGAQTNGSAAAGGAGSGEGGKGKRKDGKGEASGGGKEGVDVTDDGPPPPSFSHVDLSAPAGDVKRRHPMFPGVGAAAVAEVGAGECLYLPTGWFHEVTSFSAPGGWRITIIATGGWRGVCCRRCGNGCSLSLV